VSLVDIIVIVRSSLVGWRSKESWESDSLSEGKGAKNIPSNHILEQAISSEIHRSYRTVSCGQNDNC